jgi:hypothetical protein
MKNENISKLNKNKKSQLGDVKRIVIMVLIIAVVLGIIIFFVIPNLGKAWALVVRALSFGPK